MDCDKINSRQKKAIGERLWILVLVLCVMILCGCRKAKPFPGESFWTETEKLVSVQPEKAQQRLDSISSPEYLSGRNLARWCMLSGKINDTLYTSLPSSFLFERAGKWYRSHGTAEEKVRIQLYLGRAYVEEREYDKAMSVYIRALEEAEENRLDDLCGYINSYMGDLYEEKDLLEQAMEKFEIAAKQFRQSGNLKSYAYALRDVGRIYLYVDSFSCALDVLYDVV